MYVVDKVNILRVMFDILFKFLSYGLYIFIQYLVPI